MEQVIKDMKECWQVEGKQSILDHGISVLKYTKDLIRIIKGKESKFNQKIPQWILDNSEFILKNIVTEKKLKMYTVFHDCGKPYCKPDSQIKFKDHECESEKIWLQNFPEEKTVAQLIRNDMKIHKVRSSNFEEFMQTPNLVTHILVGLAEMNSNAEMFGGIQSDSYKIKYKNFDKYGKRALYQLMEQSKL